MHVNHISQLEIVIADFLVLALTQCSHSGCTVTSGVEQEISTMNKELLEIQETMASLKKVWVLCSLLPNKSLELSFSADMLDCRSCMADLATQSIWRSSAGQHGCLQKIPRSVQSMKHYAKALTFAMTKCPAAYWGWRIQAPLDVVLPNSSNASLS